ncbi:MAG TPA: hypothetical protein VF300_02180 [Methanothrix sp.]
MVHKPQIVSSIVQVVAIHLPGAPQMHIARLAAFAPGCHPVVVGLRALPALLDLLHLPHDQVLQPGRSLRASASRESLAGKLGGLLQ